MQSLCITDGVCIETLNSTQPLLAVGIGVSWLVHRWKNRPLKVLEAASREAEAGQLHTESASVLKTVYK